MDARGEVEAAAGGRSVLQLEKLVARDVEQPERVVVDRHEVVGRQLLDRLGIEVEESPLPTHAECVVAEVRRARPLAEHVECGPEVGRLEHCQAGDVGLVVDLVDDEPSVVRI